MTFLLGEAGQHVHILTCFSPSVEAVCSHHTVCEGNPSVTAVHICPRLRRRPGLQGTGAEEPDLRAVLIKTESRLVRLMLLMRMTGGKLRRSTCVAKRFCWVFFGPVSCF